MRQTSNPNLVQIAVRERLAKYVKYKASVFIFIFPGLAYWKWPAGRFWRTMAKITPNHARMFLLRSARWPTIF